MYFRVLANGEPIPKGTVSQAYLHTDNWDDWFKYSTLYVLIVIDASGAQHNLGGVKIGQFGMAKDQRRPDIPIQFDVLDEGFFSLGQDDSYYTDLNGLGAAVQDKVLIGLRDMARDEELFHRALEERVTGESLLRSVQRATVLGQFRRIIFGGTRLSQYRFKYTAAKPFRDGVAPATLSFFVEPESLPPTNIHVLIGRNGVGKTTILNNMSRVLVEDGVKAADVGELTSEMDEFSDDKLFANLVSVAFSAFDPFEPIPTKRDKSKGVQYTYIGLKHVGLDNNGEPLPPKTPQYLSKEFSAGVSICRQGARSSRWRRALEMLEYDPIFQDAGVALLASDQLADDNVKPLALDIFRKMSSGHKIVLLTITRLVESVEERTLVLLDEPEAHLHPPLLAAFIRALSDLLINRNGVAVIATHSPVVLQEVPSHCVWKVRRDGSHAVAERPEIETFGENVGVLTREVFGLEVSQSGFHRMLRDAVNEESDFDQVVQRFSGALGSEARTIVRALSAAKQNGEAL